MSLSINYNSAALQAENYLNQTTSAENTSIQRLSSGYKINSAADDPAGWVISQKLQSQLGGLSQAINNSNDAINMVQTAQGALDQVNSLLLSMRNLAVQASNTGTNDTASLAADQKQIASAINELNTISTNTQFGEKNLLDGSAGTTVQKPRHQRHRRRIDGLDHSGRLHDCRCYGGGHGCSGHHRHLFCARNDQDEPRRYNRYQWLANCRYHQQFRPERSGRNKRGERHHGCRRHLHHHRPHCLDADESRKQ